MVIKGEVDKRRKEVAKETVLKKVKITIRSIKTGDEKWKKKGTWPKCGIHMHGTSSVCAKHILTVSNACHVDAF